MKIGSTVYTKKNGIIGSGTIIDSKKIPYFDKSITLFKVESPEFGMEWINSEYLEERP